MSRLSIIIINWNQNEAVRQCLRSLAGWHEVDPAIWLVDNASTEPGIRSVQREFNQVRFILSSQNLGWGGGNNLALRQIETPLVLLLNSDATISESSVARMIRHLEVDPRLAAVAPMLENHNDETTIISAGGRDVGRHIRTHLRPSELRAKALAAGTPIAVDYVPGAVAIWRTEVIRELGLFEESYFFGGEIAEICERARDLGYRVAVIPDITATHDLGCSSEARTSLYPYYILRNRFLFVRRRRAYPLPFLAAWSLYGLAKTGSAVLKGNLRGARLYALGLLDGVLNRSGNQNKRVQPL